MTDTFSHRYALLIGVDDLTLSPNPLPLSVAERGRGEATVRDVQALAVALIDPDLCAYPEAHLRLLHGAGAVPATIGGQRGAAPISQPASGAGATGQHAILAL